MGFTQAISTCFSGFVKFSGRARRSEYWYFILFTLLVSVLATFVDSALGFWSGGPFSLVSSLVIFLPSLAVSVRRLHDLDKSGWWLLLPLAAIILVPLAIVMDGMVVMALACVAALVAVVVLLVWFCSRGTMAPNRFGPDPIAM